MVERKKGDKTTSIPGWVVAVGFAMLGGMVTDICKTVTEKIKNKKNEEK